MRNSPVPKTLFLLALAGITFASLHSPSFANAPIDGELKGMLHEVEILGKRHDWDRAGPIADAAVKKYPDSYEAHMLRGGVKLNLEEEDKAIAEFEWAHKKRPGDWRNTEYLSDTYTQVGKDDLALKYINLSLSVCTKVGPKACILMKKQEILRRLRRYLEAEECATQALKLLPRPHWYLERLKLRVKNCHWQDAVEDANRALLGVPQFKTAILQMRAQANIGLKRYQDAERDLDSIIKIAPYSREFHMDRLRLYKLQGRKDSVAREEAAIKGLDDGIN